MPALTAISSILPMIPRATVISFTAGALPITLISAVFTGPDASAFAYSGVAGVTIPPFTTLHFLSTFTPQHLGPHSAVVHVTFKVGDSPAAVQCQPRTGNGTARRSEPNSSLLQINGSGGQATIHVGDCVTLAMQVRFKGSSAYVDLTNDSNTTFFTDPARSQFVNPGFVTRNTWCAGADSAGKTLTLYGRYTDPDSGVFTTSTVIVHVLPGSS